MIDLGPAYQTANDVLVRRSGRIVMAGRGNRPGHGSDMLVIRLRADGTFDSTFAGDGRAYVDFSGEDDAARAMRVDRFGRVVVTGEARKDGVARFGLARLRAK